MLETGSGYTNLTWSECENEMYKARTSLKKTFDKHKERSSIASLSLTKVNKSVSKYSAMN